MKKNVYQRARIYLIRSVKRLRTRLRTTNKMSRRRSLKLSPIKRKSSIRRYRRSIILSLKTSMAIFFIMVGLTAVVQPQMLTSLIDHTETKAQEPISTTFTYTESHEQSVHLPVRIIIPRVQIDIPIAPAELINGYWQVFEDSAGFGLGSGLPDSNGNTVIFAHAREGLFKNLELLTPGDSVTILTDKTWYRFNVETITLVHPNDTYVVAPTTDRRLTLFTCSGFFDEKRLVVTARPITE